MIYTRKMTLLSNTKLEMIINGVLCVQNTHMIYQNDQNKVIK